KTTPDRIKYVAALNNTDDVPLDITFHLAIPPSVNPPLQQAFCLVGANPIHIYFDAALSQTPSDTGTSVPAMPLQGVTPDGHTCVSEITVALHVPAASQRFISINLDFAGKGAGGFNKNAARTYAQGLLFVETLTKDAFSLPLTNTTGLIMVG